MYYEIHFLSNFDACPQCSSLIRKEAKRLKDRFGEKLFIFYHSWYAYIKPSLYPFPYRVKFKISEDAVDWDVVRGTFNFKDYSIKVVDDEKDRADASSCKILVNQKTSRINLRLSTKLTIVPSYYIGVIHQYEGKVIDILQ